MQHKSQGYSKDSIHDIAFSFQLGGGKSATFFGHPYPKFIQHEQPPPCHWNLTPTRSKSYTWGALVGKSVPRLPWLPGSAPWVCFQKMVGDDITKATRDWKGLRITVKLTIQERQAQIEAVPSASALIIKTLKDPPWDRKKQKTIKHSGNITLDEIVNIAWQMRPRSLARELFRTITEIWGRPGLWAAMKMAPTLMTSQMTTTVVQGSARLVKNDKGRYFD